MVSSRHFEENPVCGSLLASAILYSHVWYSVTYKCITPLPPSQGILPVCVFMSDIFLFIRTQCYWFGTHLMTASSTCLWAKTRFPNKVTFTGKFSIATSFFLKTVIYLFNGCAGSLQHMGFLSCGKQMILSSFSQSFSLQWCLSLRTVSVLVVRGLSYAACGIMKQFNMESGVALPCDNLCSLARDQTHVLPLEGRFVTTGPPGKSPQHLFSPHSFT